MTKKFTLMMLFLLLFGAVSFSQTASLATVTASPGENKAVALNVTGFNSTTGTGPIGSITFYIRFKPSVMTFTGISNASMGASFLSGVTDSTINIVWTGFPYVNFPDGKLLDMNFTYNGMTTSPLNFLGNCEVTQGVTVIHPVYTNGSVSMAIVPQKATLTPVTAATGGNVSVPIEYLNLPAVAAMTQKIHYDPTKLNFISVTGVGNLSTGTNYSANINTGIITITWTNLGGMNINWPSRYELNFVYIGSTTTNIDFVAGCIMSTPSPVSNIPVTYYGGTCSLNNSPAATAVFGSVSGATQGSDYEVPLTLTGFPTGVAGGTQAFTLTIPFDSPRLSFLGIKSPAPAGLIVSQASGTLILAWSNPSGPNINGPTPFLTLKFKYNGIGTANVAFGNGCSFSTYNAGVTGTVQVGYTNATISPAPATANARIGFVPGTVGSNVLVPVNFELLPANMGAVTLLINYDYDKLTFVDAQNNTHGANVNLIGSTHTIKIAWNAGSATDINGKFLDLRFTYNGGGGGCGAPVSFTDGCELADFSAVIVPANYISGGVNLIFKISGTLTYNSAPNTPIPLVGFTVNLKTNPAMALVGTTTTDALGYFEFWAANGNYVMEALAPSGYVWSADLDDVVAMFDYVGGTPLPDQNALRIAAGDVNQNGDIDLDDVVDVFYKVGGETLPDYLAPDWVFGNPAIIVNCADLPNQNFMGLNTGNVLGSNPTPNP
jgi:hypothetical protein